jgi:outer membrane protein assembly factor BamA
VAAVTVAGSPGLPLRELLATLGLRVGGVLDRGGLEAGLERLRGSLRERRYWRAQVGSPSLTREGEEATVVVPLEAGPRFSFHFHGNHRFPDDLLESVLGYDGSEPLDSATVWRLARRLESFYRYRGFHEVHVEPREVLRPDGEQAVLAFDVLEGHPLRVREVSFRGNSVLSGAVLREMLVEHIRASEPQPEGRPRLLEDPLELTGRGRSRRAKGAGPVQDAATVFVEGAYRGAAEVMEEVYRERGFLQAQVRFTRLKMDLEGRTAEVSFEVKEGPRVWVSEVGAEGGPPGFEAVPLVPLKVGEPLSPEAMERGRQALLRALGRQGYLFARAEAELRLEGEQARVLYRLEPGPQVRVGRVLVRGLVRTGEEVVRSTVRVREEAVLNPEDMFESQRQLTLLNVFRSVTVRLDKPDVPEATKDVVVEVLERPRMEGEVAGGYFLVDGPRLVLDTAWPNVDGQGLSLAARAKLNYVGWSAQVLDPAVTSPTERERLQGLRGFGGRATLSAVQSRLYSLLPMEVGARLDLIGERVHRPSYISTRGAAVAGLDWAVTRWLSVSLQGELENNHLGSNDGLLTTASRADQERLRFPYGLFLLASVRPSATLDLRDDPANPHKGLLVSTSAELTRGLDSRPTNSKGEPLPELPINGVKLAGNVSVYAPLGNHAVLALSVRGGTIVPLEKDAQVIGSKRFFLGGSTSLRGFREDGILAEDRREELRQELDDCRALIHPSGCSPDLLAVLGGRSPTSEGGEMFTLAKAELRIPAGESLDLGLFLEAGNLWLDRTNFTPQKLRYGTGVGLRYVTPVGPLALDLGLNLDPDRTLNEPVAQIHFNIGAF